MTDACMKASFIMTNVQPRGRIQPTEALDLACALGGFSSVALHLHCSQVQGHFASPKARHQGEAVAAAMVADKEEALICL